uniref:Capsid protein n=1 Tax=Rosellinia necatrix partitivirus 15 TaxID=2699383 RepID=A0A6F8QGN5_9VIRU|nr:capsid protein [Rosellinia necatrix partitivirus 15]
MPAAASRNTTSFAKKTNETHYKDFKIPDQKGDFISSYKGKSGINDSDSNDLLIAVMPDYRPIFCCILYHVMKHFPEISLKGHAKVSPATLGYYCLFIVYAHLLFNDYSISGSPSRHASEIFNHDEYKNFFFSILDLPVPAFLKTILENMCYTTLPSNNDVTFILSALGYSFHHDFGRHIPLSFFSNLHDNFPTTMSKDSLPQAWARFFNRPLFKAPARSSATASRDFFPTNYLGIMSASATEYHYVNHRMYQLLESIYNPFLTRTYSRRDSFSKIGLFTPEFSNMHINPYTLLFSLDIENLTEMTVVLHAVRDTLKGTIDCSTDLAGLLASASGINLLQHGYSEYALPTWHASELTKFTVDSAITDTQIRPSKYAENLHFLQQHDETASTNMTLPKHGTDAADTDLVNVIVDYTANGTDLSPAKTSYIKFDPARHQYPQVLVLCPKEKEVEQLYKTTLCGLVIESFSIDGTGIHLPNPESPIGDINLEILSSAVRLDAIRPATKFLSSTTQLLWHRALPRFRNLGPSQPSATLLHNMSRIYIPLYAKKVIGTERPYLNTIGLTPWKKLTDPSQPLSFYGSSIKTFDNADDNELGSKVADPSNFPKELLTVWSPYRYVSLPSRKRPLTAATDYDTIYMLTNLRTIFGTAAPIVGVSHFMQCLPN